MLWCRMVHGLLIHGHEEFFICRSPAFAVGREPGQEHVLELLTTLNPEEWHHGFQAGPRCIIQLFLLRKGEPGLIDHAPSTDCSCMPAVTLHPQHHRIQVMFCGAGELGATARGGAPQGGQPDPFCRQGHPPHGSDISSAAPASPGGTAGEHTVPHQPKQLCAWCRGCSDQPGHKPPCLPDPCFVNILCMHGLPWSLLAQH